MSAPPNKSAAPGKLVVMFDRFGPYHVARLNALARDFAVTGLECFGESGEYAWERVATPPSFQRVTLFPDRRASQSGALEIIARVRAALTAAQPEAVAIPGWAHPGARAALQWCVESRVPALLLSESTAHDAPRSWVKEWVKARIVGLFSAALVGGRSHAEYLRQLGFPAARIFTGYDAVDNAHFARGAKETRSAECGVRSTETVFTPGSNPQSSISPPPSAPFFLASARFIAKKNLPRLLEAYALYREAVLSEVREQKSEVTVASSRNPQSSILNPQSSISPAPTAPWDLVLLGDGPLRADLCSLIADLSLQDCVHLPGFKQYDELPSWYGGAGAFVHASTHEPWGLVVNEAMAAGRPVLVSDRCGCAPELVEEGVNGFTFDPADARQLAALLQDMARRTDRAAMGRESERIIRRWSPAAFADGMQAAVESAKSSRLVPGLLGRVLLQTLLRP